MDSKLGNLMHSIFEHLTTTIFIKHDVEHMSSEDLYHKIIELLEHDKSKILQLFSFLNLSESYGRAAFEHSNNLFKMRLATYIRKHKTTLDAIKLQRFLIDTYLDSVIIVIKNEDTMLHKEIKELEQVKKREVKASRKSIYRA